MDREQAFIGVDPGKGGFITIKTTNGYHFIDMPYHKVPNGKVSKTGKPGYDTVFHEQGMGDLVYQIKRRCAGCTDIKVAIEYVGGRGGWSATNNFNFGYIAGMQRMIFVMLGIEPELVRPQKWQSVVREGYKSIKRPSASGKTMVVDAKEMAEIIVTKEFPDIDFRKSERAKKNDDNKIDSFLICQYLMRTQKK